MTMNKTPVNRSHTVKRLLGYVSQDYRGRFLLVLLCIMVSAIASVAGSLFLKTLIDAGLLRAAAGFGHDGVPVSHRRAVRSGL